MILGGTSSATGATDPTSKASTDQAKLDGELNRFLNLLITQLKNQDPLKPMDANQFTSQLVQFANVEQQINQNANLEKLVALQQTSGVADMVSFIGKTVEATGDQVNMEKGNAEFTYELGDAADKAAITILDSTGKSVFATDGDKTAGKHTFKWDGKNSFGTLQPEGAYTVKISALNRDGSPMDVTQTTLGRVTGAGTDDNARISLFMGKVSVFMDDVKSVKENTVP